MEKVYTYLSGEVAEVVCVILEWVLCTQPLTLHFALYSDL